MTIYIIVYYIQIRDKEKERYVCERCPNTVRKEYYYTSGRTDLSEVSIEAQSSLLCRWRWWLFKHRLYTAGAYRGHRWLDRCSIAVTDERARLFPELQQLNKPEARIKDTCIESQKNVKRDLYKKETSSLVCMNAQPSDRIGGQCGKWPSSEKQGRRGGGPSKGSNKRLHLYRPPRSAPLTTTTLPLAQSPSCSWYQE